MSHIIGTDFGKSNVKYEAVSGQGEVPAWPHHPNPRFANAIGFYRAELARSRDGAKS